MTSFEAPVELDSGEIPHEVQELLAAQDPEGLITMGAVCSIWNIANDRIKKARPHLYRNRRPRNASACEEVKLIADKLLRSWDVPTPEGFMAQATVGAAEVEADNVIPIRPYGRFVTATVFE